jgi:D-alanyl-D-alanine carboxypeptidase/D-alanyl-D-alanine-endopeptidase (penicillin-binding protein 4)
MITARTLVSVLKKIHDKVGFQNIKNYFPKGALSGTLKKYDLKNIYAKTGTLRHNHNLSGYLVSSEKNIYVFSIMVNHHTSSKNEVRNAISQLLNKFQKRLK